MTSACSPSIVAELVEDREVAVDEAIDDGQSR
jgi:hypothetical protein